MILLLQSLHVSIGLGWVYILFLDEQSPLVLNSFSRHKHSGKANEYYWMLTAMALLTTCFVILVWGYLNHLEPGWITMIDFWVVLLGGTLSIGMAVLLQLQKVHRATARWLVYLLIAGLIVQLFVIQVVWLQ